MSDELDKIIRQSFYEGWSWHKATLDPLNRVGQKQEDESVEKTTKAIEAYISKRELKLLNKIETELLLYTAERNVPMRNEALDIVNKLKLNLGDK